MPLTNPNKVVTEERLNEYHRTILPYLGGNSMVACGGGYAPIGTVIAYMGTRAPSDFLICDGTVYNIADYTELADFFELQFGSSNFFGGDGNTTFAVPDLRGEFLRGTGTNSHANQGSGANVGVHQDGTYHQNIYTDNDFFGIVTNSDPSYSFMNNDSVAQTAISGISPDKVNKSTAYAGQSRYYTSRPTNTSVLYCIKAKSQGNGYSLDEQIVGTWIDGKPIYQKTIVSTSIDWNNDNDMGLSSLNVDEIIDYNVIAKRTDDYVYGTSMANPAGFTYQFTVFFSPTKLVCVRTGSDILQQMDKLSLTIQYTKTTD